MSAAPVIRLEQISKSFGEVRANHDISLDIREGRILALLGDRRVVLRNGAMSQVVAPSEAEHANRGHADEKDSGCTR